MTQPLKPKTIQTHRPFCHPQLTLNYFSSPLHFLLRGMGFFSSRFERRRVSLHTVISCEEKKRSLFHHLQTLSTSLLSLCRESDTQLTPLLDWGNVYSMFRSQRDAYLHGARTMCKAVCSHLAPLLPVQSEFQEHPLKFPGPCVPGKELHHRHMF